MSWSWSRLSRDAAENGPAGPAAESGRVEESGGHHVVVPAPADTSRPDLNSCRYCGEPVDWTDDRAWIGDIRDGPDEASKLAILAAWVAAAGGETCGRTALLPALRPPPDRRLAELELRRMVRQFGLEVVDDERP